VPQAHEPGAEGEVDFHDLWVFLGGVKTKTALFTMRLSYSGRAVHRASLSQGQEAFLEAHVYAFGRLGGVPAEKIRYDNLASAVKRVVFGRTRVENQRWVAFRSHSLLTELPTLFSQFTRRIAGEVTTVSARVRRRDVRAGSRGAGRPAGWRAGRDRQPLGAIPAA
jgi:transposase